MSRPMMTASSPVGSSMPGGNPVSGATVSLARKTAASVNEVAETTTGAAGKFEFEDHGQYALLLSVEKAMKRRRASCTGSGSGNQNLFLKEPLVLRR